MIPQAFVQGHLVSEYPDFLESVTQRYEIDKQIEDVNNTIKEKKDQLAAQII